MIERHITFNVHPDRTDAFEQFFADDVPPAMAASPGFVRADLLREADSPTRYQMVLRFEDRRQRRRVANIRGPPGRSSRSSIALYADNEIRPTR